ncbi:MAG: hypothetical protein GY803_29050 [Chloroflexi bacterium]|nr:hypothetical protein [Chloroflexota bacterium]
MDELSKRIEHIKTVLSHEELRTLSFDLGLNYSSIESDDSNEFAENLLSYLKETDQLESLVHTLFLDESMSEEVSPERGKLIQLHNTLMSHSDKMEVIIQACEDIPLTGWRKYEQLDDRDFYREILILAERRGWLDALESMLTNADLSSQLASFSAASRNEQSLDARQKDDLLEWMNKQASVNDLTHLAFLMGKDSENFSLRNTEEWIDEFVSYFEKRGRLNQVLAAKKRITD